MIATCFTNISEILKSEEQADQIREHLNFNLKVSQNFHIYVG